MRLPVGVSDPLAVLRCVSAEVRNDKSHHQELAASTLLGLLEPLPQGVLAAMVGVVQHQPLFNVIVTNVPGPPVPLYALGDKLLEAFPIVPLAVGRREPRFIDTNRPDWPRMGQLVVVNRPEF